MATDPFLAFEAALPAIIAESPRQIMRVRETAADTFRAPVPYTQGPYTVRIEPAKSSAMPTFDEKGTTIVSLFEMVGHNLPRTVVENGATVPLFRLEDQVSDGENLYSVVSPPYYRGKVVQVTLSLLAK